MNIRNFKLLRWFGINGIVLWPFVIYAEKNPDPVILNHESIHLDQIRRTGVAKFYVKYLAEYFMGRKNGLSHDEAYRNISFEREAYLHQHDLAYLEEIRGKRART